MRNIGVVLVVFLLTLFFFNANIVFAGFGITPSTVWNDHLLPGSHFEETIYLVQSKPEKDLLAKIEIDAPEIKDWISIDRGFEFTIPAGSQQFPIKVIIDIPQKAEFKNYDGKIWVKTMPVTKEGEGMVTVALGAIISLSLRVSSEEIYGFAFRGITIKDIEEGRPIKVTVTLQNVGNTESAPSKIHLDVYDAYLTGVLQSSDITKIEPLKAFETKEIILKFPNKLTLGSYFGSVQVFKDEKSIGEAKAVFNVLERTGIIYKIFSKWYSWIVLIVVILTGIAIGFRKTLKQLINNWNSKKRERKRQKLEEKLKKLEK
ncbi:MAG: hypothetical protein Q8N56_02095 [bacterium]|nr:hypothetical protein [bacterium]